MEPFALRQLAFKFQLPLTDDDEYAFFRGIHETLKADCDLSALRFALICYLKGEDCAYDALERLVFKDYEAFRNNFIRLKRLSPTLCRSEFFGWTEGFLEMGIDKFPSYMEHLKDGKDPESKALLAIQNYEGKEGQLDAIFDLIAQCPLRDRLYHGALSILDDYENRDAMIPYLERAAKDGSPSCAYLLARWKLGDDDEEGIIPLFETAIKEYSPEYLYAYADYLLDERHDHLNQARGLQLLYLAMTMGHEKATVAFSHIYFEKRIKWDDWFIHVDPKELGQRLHQAGEKGDHEAAFFYARYMEDGWIDPMEPVLHEPSRETYGRLAKKGNYLALAELAAWYLRDGNEEKARSCMDKIEIEKCKQFELAHCLAISLASRDKEEREMALKHMILVSTASDHETYVFARGMIREYLDFEGINASAYMRVDYSYQRKGEERARYITIEAAKACRIANPEAVADELIKHVDPSGHAQEPSQA